MTMNVRRISDLTETVYTFRSGNRNKRKQNFKVTKRIKMRDRMNLDSDDRSSRTVS